jgi:uncharacterized protein YqhQ
VDLSITSWFLITLAAFAANVPFLNERLFAIVFMPRAVKPVWLRLIELLILYLVVGGIAYLLEAAAGNAFRQGWECYAITLFLFIVLAYPGFVFRYLRKRRG